MSDHELPPLPVTDYTGSDDSWLALYGPYWTEDMREYARDVERAAYERAAQECFERPYLEVLHDDYWTACKDCADAIRALGSEK